MKSGSRGIVVQSKDMKSGSGGVVVVVVAPEQRYEIWKQTSL
jgi:hypothetical protein